MGDANDKRATDVVKLLLSIGAKDEKQQLLIDELIASLRREEPESSE